MPLATILELIQRRRELEQNLQLLFNRSCQWSSAERVRGATTIENLTQQLVEVTDELARRRRRQEQFHLPSSGLISEPKEASTFAVLWGCRPCTRLDATWSGDPPYNQPDYGENHDTQEPGYLDATGLVASENTHDGPQVYQNDDHRNGNPEIADRI